MLLYLTQFHFKYELYDHDMFTGGLDVASVVNVLSVDEEQQTQSMLNFPSIEDQS
jgi:hypothetical protein